MEKEVLISMIIPIYNCEEYLKRCLDSIISQANKDIEIILVDDGSQDKSGVICDDYQKRNENIIVIHQKNAGVSAARNNALKKAKGKYICFADSDDYLSDGYFKEIKRILKKYPEVELINFGYYSDVNDDNQRNISSDEIKYKNNYYKSHEELKKDFINLWDSSMLYNIVNKTYKKELIDNNKIKFPNEYFGEDIAFNRLYLDSINTFYNSNKCFYHYIREREGSITTKYKSDFFEIRKKEFFDFNEYFKNWNIPKEEYYEFSCRRYIERTLGCIENVYCSKLKLSDRYKDIKKMINEPITREALKNIKPKSKKIKLMLIPIKLKLTLTTMLMGRIFHIVKTKFPAFFNRLKNRR